LTGGKLLENHAVKLRTNPLERTRYFRKNQLIKGGDGPKTEGRMQARERKN